MKIGLDVSRSLAPQGPGYGVRRPSGVSGLGAGTQALWGQELTRVLRGRKRRRRCSPQVVRELSAGGRQRACLGQSADQTRDRVRGSRPPARSTRPAAIGSTPCAAGTRRTGVTIDSKLRSSIIEGLSVFLSVFDLPDIAATFCPRKPPGDAPAGPAAPAADTAAVARRLPPLDEVISSGKVLCLKMPAGRHEPGPVARRGASSSKQGVASDEPVASDPNRGHAVDFVVACRVRPVRGVAGVAPRRCALASSCRSPTTGRRRSAGHCAARWPAWRRPGLSRSRRCGPARGCCPDRPAAARAALGLGASKAVSECREPPSRTARPSSRHPDWSSYRGRVTRNPSPSRRPPRRACAVLADHLSLPKTHVVSFARLPGASCVRRIEKRRR